MADIRVHIDTLEYTRDGLASREPIPLQVGQHNRVVLIRPDRVPPVPASYGGFPSNSSFPGPGVLSLMRRVHADHLGGHTYQLFAHADAAGTDGDNKALTDRRAEAARALLVGDVDALVTTWRDEAWDDTTFQVMLRALECDPGSIDGILGEVTTAAVEKFQQRYNDGDYVQASSLAEQAARFESLEVDGDLGPLTQEALVESYVIAFSPAVDPQALHPTHAANGCAGFNRATDDAGSALNRRVSLLVHAAAVAYPDSTPCTPGDPQRCPVVGEPRLGCMWYREHVREPAPALAQHEHFSPSWLQLPNGRFMLSVLTTVPEEETVTFEVWRSTEPADDTSHEPPSFFDEPLSESITVNPVRGIAQVVWDPPETFAPSEAGRVETAQGEPGWVPVFRVHHEGSNSGKSATRHASFPGRALVVLFSRSDLGGTFKGSDVHELELTCDNGMSQRRPATSAVEADPANYILRFEGFPESGTFSLVAHHGDRTQHTVFEGVEYAQLEARPEADPVEFSTGIHWWSSPQDAVIDPPPELSFADDEDDELGE
ncbi:MAG: peptidoglycan-binding protein [Nannocystales bacterium]